jgi:tetratricopeptide (TPR) repeat protein
MLTEREFNEVQQRITGAWHRGQLDEAFAEIERVLAGGLPKMKAQCLLYRGMMRQGAGALTDARHDWMQALRYARRATYLRFQLEHHIGEALEQEGQPAEALSHYRKALKTCSDGGEFSGHQTLTAYLRLKGGEIDAGDEALLASVAAKSWRVLELPGAPNLEDLTATVAALSDAFSHRAE